MEQKEAVMVLFDREEEYARLLSEFFEKAEGTAMGDPYIHKDGGTVGTGEKWGGDNAGSGGIFLHGYAEYIGAGMPGDS